MPDKVVGFGTKPDIVISPYSFDKEVFLKIKFSYNYLSYKPVLISTIDFGNLFLLVRDSVSAKIRDISERHPLGRGASEVLSLADTIGNLGKEVLAPKHSFGIISLDSWTKEGKEKHQVVKEVSDFLKEEILRSGLAEFISKRAEEDPEVDSFFLKKNPKKISKELLFKLEESVSEDGGEWSFILSWALDGGNFYYRQDLEDLIGSLEKSFGPGSRNLDLEAMEKGDVGGWYTYNPSVTKILIGAETVVKEKGIKVFFEEFYLYFRGESFFIEIPARVRLVLASYSVNSEVNFSGYNRRKSVGYEDGQRVLYGLDEGSKVIYYNRFLLALHDKEVDVRVEAYNPDTTDEYKDIFKKRKEENESKLLAVEPLSGKRVASSLMSKFSLWKDKLSLVKEVSGKLSGPASYSSELLKNIILLSPHLSVFRALEEKRGPGVCLNGKRVDILDDSETVAFNNIEFIGLLKRLYGKGNPRVPKGGSLYNVLVISKEAIEDIIRDTITIEDIFSRDSRAFLTLERSPFSKERRSYENIKLFLYMTKNPVVLIGDNMELLDGSTGTRLSFLKDGKPFYRYDFGKGARSVILGKLLSFYKEIEWGK